MAFLLLSFKEVYNFGNYLAITPPYDFQKHTLIENSWFKCYVVIVGIVSALGEAWSLWYRAGALKSFRTSIKVCDFINEISLFGAFIVIKFDLCLLKAKRWSDFLSLLRFLNKHLKNKNDKKSTVFFATGQIVLVNVFFCVFSLYQWAALCNTDMVELDLLATYVVHYVNYYNILYVLIVMNTILFIVEKKFKTLNDDFKQQFMISRKFTSGDVSNIKSVGVVRQIGFLLRKFNDAIDIFNNLFGYVITLKLTNIVITVIVMLNVSFLSSSLGRYNSNINDRNVIVSNIMATCFTLSWTIIFVLLCQRIINEAKNTIKLCYAFQEQVPANSEEREELLKLAQMAEHKIPVFSAAGYFEINKCTLTSIFSTVTTYVIVLIQLNISMY